MKIKYFSYMDGKGMGNLMWEGTFPMKGGKFPAAHPVAEQVDGAVDRAMGKSKAECSDCLGHGILLDADINCPTCNGSGANCEVLAAQMEADADAEALQKDTDRFTACDHLVGIYYGDGEAEYVRVSNRASVAQWALEGCRRWLAAGLGAKYAVDRVRLLDAPEKALADKADLFTYCPDCGERLKK